jgi:hypothetical protein
MANLLVPTELKVADLLVPTELKVAKLTFCLSGLCGYS